jgi:hypothetical protein
VPSNNELVELFKVVQATQKSVEGIRPLTPQSMIEHLQASGYRIVKKDPILDVKRFWDAKTATLRYERGIKTVKFAVVSDTQLGSRQQQLTWLHTFYDRVKSEGIDTVFHVGDVCDGDGRVYPGQQFDLHVFGSDAQQEYVEKVYPKRDGVTTKMIAGNHDWSFWVRGGRDILAAVSQARPDMVYLGPMYADVNLEGLRIGIMHMKGSLTYARSYKLQKIIEQFTPGDKPEILFAGDKHSWAHVPMYRNVYGWQVGCFQSQTLHEKRLGLYPELGGLIIEVSFGSKGADRPNGIVSIKHDFVPYFVPKKKDY